MLLHKAVPLLLSVILASLCVQLPVQSESRPAASDAPSLSLPKFEPECAPLFEMRYHTVWRLLADNTMFPDRLHGWDEWEHKFDGRLADQHSTESAINELIGSLKD